MLNKIIFKSIYLLICFYIILVTIDYFIPRVPKIFSKSYSQSKKIIQSRIEEDQKYLLKSKNKYDPMMYANDYNLHPLNKIVKKYNIIPLGTLANKKLLLCSEGYGPIIINTDRFGFRNRDSVWDSNNIDTVVIGDSFVEGQCVNEKDSFVSLISKKSSINLIRLAQGGYSPAHYAFFAKIFLPEIKPKNVIMMFYQNDNDLIDMGELHYKFFFLKNVNDYLEKKDGKLQSTQIINQFNDEVEFFLEKKKKNIESRLVSIFDNLIRNFDKLKKYLVLTNIKKNFQLLFKPKNLIGSNSLAIDTLMRICKEIKCKPYFVLIRGSDFWDPQPNFYYNNYKAAMQEYLKVYNKELITLDEDIDYLNLKYFAPKGPHYSIESNKIVAKKLNKIINIDKQ